MDVVYNNEPHMALYADDNGLYFYDKILRECRKLFSKIRCNNNYIPKKNTVIKLCLSLSLDKNRFNNLLSSAGYSLSKNNNFDLVISYCIENNIYDINVINDYLYTYAGVIL
jgi:methylase of polypeptide subunit release factors